MDQINFIPGVGVDVISMGDSRAIVTRDNSAIDKMTIDVESARHACAVEICFSHMPSNCQRCDFGNLRSDPAADIPEFLARSAVRAVRMRILNPHFVPWARSSRLQIPLGAFPNLGGSVPIA